MEIDSLQTLEAHSPPPEPPPSQQTLDGSSPNPPLMPPPTQTLSGSSPDPPLTSPPTQTLGGSSPSSQMESLHVSSPCLRTSQTLFGPLPPSDLDPQTPFSSTIDGSLSLDSETLEDSSGPDSMSSREAFEEHESLTSNRFNRFPNYSHMRWRWSSPWDPWPGSAESRSPVSLLDFGEKDPEPPLVGAGLLNLGNTCFLNAVLQCFTHTVPLVQGLRDCGHTTPCDRANEDFCALCALRHHIERSLASSGEVVAPCQLVGNLGYFSSVFRRYQQEDAHEFLQCFLDRLDNCYMHFKKQDNCVPSENDNLVNQIFGGRLISKLRCCNCGHFSETFEPLIDLSLEIEDVDTLSSALESFTKVEKIDDPEIKHTCENCKQEVSREKQFMLDRAPSIATFHLKRFKNDGCFVEKIDKYVEYPLELDLQPYTSCSQDNNLELKYELYAIVVHIGCSSTSGHYFCFIRSSPDVWYKLDDSQVIRVQEERALLQRAYILLYARQGTPWISSLMDSQKPCSDTNISNTSPKSVLDSVDNIHTSCPVLDGVDNIHTSCPTVTNIYGCEGNEVQDAAEGTSGRFCHGTGHIEDEVIVPTEPTDDTHMICTPVALRESECSDRTASNVVNTCTMLPLGENNCNQEINEGRNNASINPQTPSKSLSPDIYSKESPEPSYHIPRDHLMSENRVSCKRPLDRALEDSKRKEAVRYLQRSMPMSRGLKLLACMNQVSPNKKRNKRRKGFSPYKKPSHHGARHKHGYNAAMRHVVTATFR